MLNKSQITIFPDMRYDNWGNLFTQNRLSTTDLVNSVVDCWEYKQRYFNDNIFSVPIPTTKNGSPIIHCVIIQNNVKNFSFHSQTLDKSPLDTSNLVVRNVIVGPVNPAKFAEVIVVAKDSMFEIINVKGLHRIDVPPHPLEIAKNMKSKDACKFTYSMQDILNSIEFWAHHDFAVKQFS